MSLPETETVPNEIVPDMKKDYEFLTLIHVLIERHLRERDGVTQEHVDSFNDANGDLDAIENPLAPYFVHRQRAIHINRQLCQHMGLDWDAYQKHVGGM